MSSWPRLIIGLTLGFAAGATTAGGAVFPGIGRPATAAEVRAWDIDVRPDFKGLPSGSGSVKQGQLVWEAKCASCHGVFGESNQVFHPLVGGTTADDLKTGRVARLRDPAFPSRTTLMKLPSLSALWDYINRAMPWTQPKTLTTDEVYAVTGYMLYLGGIVADDFNLSDRNVQQVQARLPNRNGMSTAHAMWPGRALGGSSRPDVSGSLCMKDCAAAPRVASQLPEFARNAHGNLAEQNRLVGPQRGADTSRPEAMLLAGSAVQAAQLTSVQEKVAAATEGVDGRAARALAQKFACTACHADRSRLIGPSWAEIANKHSGQIDYLAGKIRGGSSGAWGSVPMPAQSLNDVEARAIAGWLAAGAGP